MFLRLFFFLRGCGGKSQAYSIPFRVIQLHYHSNYDPLRDLAPWEKRVELLFFQSVAWSWLESQIRDTQLLPGWCYFFRDFQRWLLETVKTSRLRQDAFTIHGCLWIEGWGREPRWINFFWSFYFYQFLKFCTFSQPNPCGYAFKFDIIFQNFKLLCLFFSSSINHQR